MTECQGCGAWNDTSRTLCVLCDTPLAGTDEWDAAAEPPPLPPLPDGGLRASMPSWLREPSPVTPSPPSPPLTPSAPLLDARSSSRLTAPAPEPVPLAARADPRTFLTDDDFPQWLRELAARRDETAPSSTVTDAALPATMPPAAATAPAAMAPLAAMVPDTIAVEHLGAAPEPASEVWLSVAGVPARPPEERRGRDPWETLLLVLLCLGVVVAALWALVSNGVFSPGP